MCKQSEMSDVQKNWETVNEINYTLIWLPRSYFSIWTKRRQGSGFCLLFEAKVGHADICEVLDYKKLLALLNWVARVQLDLDKNFYFYYLLLLLFLTFEFIQFGLYIKHTSTLAMCNYSWGKADIDKSSTKPSIQTHNLHDTKDINCTVLPQVVEQQTAVFFISGYCIVFKAFHITGLSFSKAEMLTSSCIFFLSDITEFNMHACVFFSVIYVFLSKPQLLMVESNYSPCWT